MRRLEVKLRIGRGFRVTGFERATGNCEQLLSTLYGRSGNQGGVQERSPDAAQRNPGIARCGEEKPRIPALPSSGLLVLSFIDAMAECISSISSFIAILLFCLDQPKK